MVPIKIYSNADIDKVQILSDNQNKSGIYLWINSINGKQYIGSSINLSNRFRQYFNINHLTKNNSMQICRAILKHGYSNFSLIIIEYCSSEQCIEREDFYLSFLPHEYNILKKAGSWLGHEHSEKTKKIMSDIHKKIDNPGRFKPGHKKVEGSGMPSKAIEVTDIKNNTTTTYDSISEAARALNINKSVINLYFIRNQQKPYKGIYTFKKV